MYKILIVSRAFYPQNSPRSFRATELVKEFSRQGHCVTVYTFKDEEIHSEFEKMYNVTINDIGKLNYKRVSFLGKRLSHKVNRLLKMLFEYPDIEIMFKLRKILRKEKNYDLLISIAVPHPVHWGTALARNKKYPIAKKWIADCGDPYYKNTLESYKIPFYFAWIEKYFCRKADVICLPFEDLKRSFFSEFHYKIKIIPQGINFRELTIPEVRKVNPQITFAYAGGVSTSGVRSLIPFIKIILEKKVDYSFHIYPTQNKDLLDSIAKGSGGKILVHNMLPRTELISELAKMDFLVNLIIKNTGTAQIPSKLIDYGMTKLPVLNINPMNPDPEIIDEFLAKNFTRAFYLKNIDDYNIVTVCNSFIKLVS